MSDVLTTEPTEVPPTGTPIAQTAIPAPASNKPTLAGESNEAGKSWRTDCTALVVRADADAGPRLLLIPAEDQAHTLAGTWDVPR